MDVGVFWLVITFVLLLALNRWIAQHVQGIGFLLTENGQLATVIYLLLILPGVLLHELSHVMAALLLQVRVHRLSIGIQRHAHDQIVLGSVEIAQTDPIRASLIGLAPLVSGCAVILLIAGRALGLGRLEAFSLGALWQALPTMYYAPDFWLWIYLVLAVGNAMFPSAADRRAWWMALVFIAFVGVVLYFAGLLDDLSIVVGSQVRQVVNALTYAFALTVVVDAVFALLLFLTEQLLGWLGLGRIRYQDRP